MHINPLTVQNGVNRKWLFSNLPWGAKEILSLIAQNISGQAWSIVSNIMRDLDRARETPDCLDSIWFKAQAAYGRNERLTLAVFADTVVNGGVLSHTALSLFCDDTSLWQFTESERLLHVTVQGINAALESYAGRGPMTWLMPEGAWCHIQPDFITYTKP